MNNLVLKLPTFGFVVGTRVLLGVGVGLLLSRRMSDCQRRAVGLTLLGIGAATTIPAAMAVFGHIEKDTARLSRSGGPDLPVS